MDKVKHRAELAFAGFIDYFLIVVCFAICWYLYYSKIIINPFFRKGNYVVIFLYALFVIIISRVYNSTQISLSRISEMIYNQALSIAASDALIYIVICILKRGFANLLPGLLCFVIQVILAALWCLLANWWYFSKFPPKKTIVIFDNHEGLEDLISEYGLSNKFDVQKTVQVDDCLADLSILDDFETAFLSDIHSKDRNKIMKRAVENDMDIYIIPRLGDIILSGAKDMHMFHRPMLRLRRYNPHIEYLFFKRLFDIVISGLALIIMSPFMLITAIVIKAYDGGPAFYKQVRLTKDGKEFEILKFRSMRVDAEKYTGAILSAGDDDPRITPVGRIIRKIRFDELPQLINIIKGDMSIVGPRPERPEIAAEYEKTLPEFKLRLQTKAGLTGYAQVYGKYNTSPYNKLQMDLMYIAHPSFLEDLRICLTTVKILFLKESTEGVALKTSNSVDNEITLNVQQLGNSGETAR